MAGERKLARNLMESGSETRLRETLTEALKETHIRVSSKIFILKSSLHHNIRHVKKGNDVSYFFLWHRICYRPQRSCGQGYVFTRVCDSVQRGSLPQCMLGYPTPEQAPPTEQAPPGSRHPLREQAPQPPPPGIRSMSGRYASYWNAFLLSNIFT